MVRVVVDLLSKIKRIGVFINKGSVFPGLVRRGINGQVRSPSTRVPRKTILAELCHFAI